MPMFLALAIVRVVVLFTVWNNGAAAGVGGVGEKCGECEVLVRGHYIKGSGAQRRGLG